MRNRTTNLNGLIEYVMNGDKTDEMKYVNGVFVNIMDYLY